MLGEGVAHNDIKANNICVRMESNGPVATLIDLGNVRRKGTRSFYISTEHTGRYPWIAPELLLHTHPCSEASDVYGLAFLI